jgi:hypothetical protein
MDIGIIIIIRSCNGVAVIPNRVPSHVNKPGILPGLCLIFLLIALLVASFRFAPAKFQRGAGTVLVGTYLVTWGFVLVAAYYRSYTNFFLRALLWACEHFPGTGTRKMALLWSACAFLLGGSIILSGLGVF